MIKVIFKDILNGEDYVAVYKDGKVYLPLYHTSLIYGRAANVGEVFMKSAGIQDYCEIRAGEGKRKHFYFNAQDHSKLTKSRRKPENQDLIAEKVEKIIEIVTFEGENHTEGDNTIITVYPAALKNGIKKMPRPFYPPFEKRDESSLLPLPNNDITENEVHIETKPVAYEQDVMTVTGLKDYGAFMYSPKFKRQYLLHISSMPKDFMDGIEVLDRIRVGIINHGTAIHIQGRVTMQNTTQDDVVAPERIIQRLEEENEMLHDKIHQIELTILSLVTTLGW